MAVAWSQKARLSDKDDMLRQLADAPTARLIDTREGRKAAPLNSESSGQYRPANAAACCTAPLSADGGYRLRLGVSGMPSEGGHFPVIADTHHIPFQTIQADQDPPFAPLGLGRMR